MDKKHFDNLTRIFDEEIHNFKQLLKYEKLKNNVIIRQEVDKLKKLSREEEDILDNVAKLEEEREHIVDDLFKKYKINSEKVLSSLLKILPEDKDNYKNIIKEKKNELIRNIKDLKKINNTNNRLLSDSIKFFNYAVSSIQDIDPAVYDHNGSMPKDHDSSWVINKKA